MHVPVPTVLIYGVLVLKVGFKMSFPRSRIVFVLPFHNVSQLSNTSTLTLSKLGNKKIEENILTLKCQLPWLQHMYLRPVTYLMRKKRRCTVLRPGNGNSNALAYVTQRLIG